MTPLLSYLKNQLIYVSLFLLLLIICGLTNGTFVGKAYAVTVIGQDNFQRANQSGWGTASDGQKWGADGQNGSFFHISGNTGEISITNGETYNAIIGPTAADSEVVFKGYMSVSCEFENMGAILHWQDSNNWYKAYIGNDSTNTNCTDIVLQKRFQGTYYDMKTVSINI